MTTMRKGDSEPHARFRENRFFHSMEQWYFLTRERTVEGPFENRDTAEKMLQSYLGELQNSVN